MGMQLNRISCDKGEPYVDVISYDASWGHIASEVWESTCFLPTKNETFAPAFRYVHTWDARAIPGSSFNPLIATLWKMQFSTHLKLWVAVATHNFKWLKITRICFTETKDLQMLMHTRSFKSHIVI